ncbi:Queuosine Biosynthesis QueC ATPase [Candidatus Burkholderia humilis]|nr:Queuosine Biosynthesis QueC ATPase [Candidatus Burkholderia humilis]
MTHALLMSGGQDSIALAYWIRPSLAITVNYGQIPADAEIRAAAAVCSALDIPHEVVHADCAAVGSGDLSGKHPMSIAPVPEWWPYRNQPILTLAAGVALHYRATNLLLGTVSTDASHTDGTQAFIEQASRLFALQEGASQVSASAIEMTSSELIKRADVPMHVLAWAHSCHRSNIACGQCRGCIKHTSSDMSLTEPGAPRTHVHAVPALSAPFIGVFDLTHGNEQTTEGFLSVLNRRQSVCSSSSLTLKTCRMCYGTHVASVRNLVVIARIELHLLLEGCTQSMSSYSESPALRGSSSMTPSVIACFVCMCWNLRV